MTGELALPGATETLRLMPIFISYSSKDQKSAEAICHAIENRGFPCWISSRDIGPGENFQSQIVRAIRGAKIMVLVFSSNANNSEEIKKELVLAGQSSLVVIPVRVEDVTPDDAFAYEFATRQWIDVFGDWEHAIGRVIRQIESVVGEAPAKPSAATEEKPEDKTPEEKPAAPSAPAVAPTPVPAAPIEAKRKTPMGAIVGVAAAVILILAGVVAWQMWLKPAPQNAVATATVPPPIAIPPAPPPSNQTPAPAVASADPLVARIASLAPNSSEKVRADQARGYHEAAAHKALAGIPNSSTFWHILRPSADEARDATLELCQIAAGQACALIAVDDALQPIPPDGKWPAQDMPRVNYAGDFDPGQMPGATPEIRGRADFAGYRGLNEPKAIGFHLAGNIRYFIATGPDQHTAEVDALKHCDNDETAARSDLHQCFLYASGNRVVFPQHSSAPITAETQAAANPAPNATAPAPNAAVSGEPPKTFRDCANCPEMVVIPAGSFTMGAAPGENQRYQVPAEEAARDGPQHRVTFAKPFALAEFDVTRGEFAAFAHTTGFTPHPGCMTVMGNNWVPQPKAGWEDPGYPQTDNDPVVCMNMLEISAYLRWLSNTTGKSYRLPSEAEWEYAERAGSTTTFYWGDEVKDACTHENVGDEAYGRKYAVNGPIPCNDGYSDLAPVGSFKPNAFGLYDMAGNVFEQIADCWNENYVGAPTDGSAWMSGECGRHVVRKAAFGNPHPFMFRAASRNVDGEIAKRNRYGFRVAVSLE
jgi:formylglycine-generating enzyme required for sulfatase activity